MLSSRGTFAFPSQADLDARYVRRFVGATLAADTIQQTNSGGTEIALVAPNGSINAGLALDTSNTLKRVGVTGRFNIGSSMIRASAISAPAVQFIRSRGTVQTPTGALSGDAIGALSMLPVLDGGLAIAEAAQFAAVLRENAVSGSVGTLWRLRAANIGSSALQDLLDVYGLGVGVAGVSSPQGTLRMFAASSLQIRNPANSSSLFEADATGLAFFNVPTVARQLVPLGSTTDQVITALNNLGLFRLV